MNIRQLECLRELVNRGGFTRAAETLGISQPALSIQIRKLEEEADLALIDRNSKPIVLSSEGEIFFDLATEVLDRMDALKDLSVSLSDKIAGTLRIGVIPTLAPYLIPIFIEELNKSHPDLELVVEEQITESIIQHVKSGHFDAGIIATPISSKGLYFKSLFFERFFLYISEKHSLYSLEEIALEETNMDEVWYLKEGNCFSNQVNSICMKAGMPNAGSNLSYFSNSIESLRRIVEQKKGLTFIPELATIEVPVEFEEMIKPIKGMNPHREISLVSKPNTSRKKHLDALVEVMLSKIPARMKKQSSDWIVDTDLRIV